MQKTIPMKDYNVNSIHLEITGKCNLMCKYCYNAQFNDEQKICNEMTTEQIKKLIDEAKKMGCKRFIFSGGEPFTRKDFFEILKYVDDMKIEILTNSKLLFLNDDYIEKLKQIKNISEIKISLDGFENHDTTRVGSSYKDVLKTIKALKNNGFKIVINTEITKMNLNELLSLYNKLKELKIDRWRIDLPFILGRYVKFYKDYKLPDFSDFIKIVKEILKDYFKEKPSFELEIFNIFKSEITPNNLIEFDYNDHPCAYRKGSFPIRPNGDMIFCPSMDLPMSNYIKEGSLKKAIDKKYSHPFYDLKIKDFKECMNCRYIHLCNTGCRVDAMYYLKNYVNVDPICCNLMPLIEKEIIPILPPDLKEFYQRMIDVHKSYPKKYDIDKLVNNNSI